MELKFKKRFLLISTIIGIAFLASYKSINFQSKSINESELGVLRDIVLADSIPIFYYKTTISDLNQPLSSSLVNMDSMTLGPEERNYLVERFSTMESTNVNKLIGKPKNHTLKKLQGHDWLVISLPVVFKDGKYAIYYSKGEYSGQFILMKNIDGSWKDVCYSSVWNE